jgi:hypothetical protein
MFVKKEPHPTWKRLKELSKLTVTVSHDIHVLFQFLCGTQIYSILGCPRVFLKPEFVDIQFFASRV